MRAGAEVLSCNNEHVGVAEALVSAAFLAHLECFLSLLPSDSFSFSLLFDTTCSVLCPAATCHQHASQPQAHTADPSRCPGLDTVVEGARGQGRQSDTTDRRRKSQKKIGKKQLAGLGYYISCDLKKSCVCDGSEADDYFIIEYSDNFFIN